MGTAGRICLALAAVLAIAGVVYGLTSHEVAGAALLLVGAVTFAFLGLVSRAMARRVEEGGADPAVVHVPPTIWPLGFSIAAVIIALGLVISPWILAPGGIAFAVSAAGWLREVARARAGASHAGDAGRT